MSEQPARPLRGWMDRVAPRFTRQARRASPNDHWVKCPATGELVYRQHLEAAHWVTPSGHHMRIGAAQRFTCTFDQGRHRLLTASAANDDPLGFSFGKSYTDALAAARKDTGQHDAMGAAVGEIVGVPAVVAVQDFAFLAGSVSAAVGETFLRAVDEAILLSAPLVAFPSGAGMRMQQGSVALMQMARMAAGIQRLRARGLPYLTVLTDPTTGGTLASYAMLGDIQFAEPGALIGFTGRRVIAQTIRETLPDNYQTAEFQLSRGVIDRVVPRSELPARLGATLRLLMHASAPRTGA